MGGHTVARLGEVGRPHVQTVAPSQRLATAHVYTATTCKLGSNSSTQAVPSAELPSPAGGGAARTACSSVVRGQRVPHFLFYGRRGPNHGRWPLHGHRVSIVNRGICAESHKGRGSRSGCGSIAEPRPGKFRLVLLEGPL